MLFPEAIGLLKSQCQVWESSLPSCRPGWSQGPPKQYKPLHWPSIGKTLLPRQHKSFHWPSIGKTWLLRQHKPFH